MVAAIQVWMHGGYRTVSTTPEMENAGVMKTKAANLYDAPARVKEFPSEADAWK